jgi:hypothetical protein
MSLTDWGRALFVLRSNSKIGDTTVDTQAEPKAKTKVLIVLNRELDRTLDEIAQRQGESRSNIVRTALREYARKEKEAA